MPTEDDRYRRLVWDLRWLAAEPDAALGVFDDEQIVPEEMALSFDDALKPLARGLPDAVRSILVEIDRTFDEMSGEANAALWKAPIGTFGRRLGGATSAGAQCATTHERIACRRPFARSCLTSVCPVCRLTSTTARKRPNKRSGAGRAVGDGWTRPATRVIALREAVPETDGPRE